MGPPRPVEGSKGEPAVANPFTLSPPKGEPSVANPFTLSPPKGEPSVATPFTLSPSKGEPSVANPFTLSLGTLPFTPSLSRGRAAQPVRLELHAGAFDGLRLNGGVR